MLNSWMLPLLYSVNSERVISLNFVLKLQDK